MIAPAPAVNQVKKKVFVKIGRPGTSVPLGVPVGTFLGRSKAKPGLIDRIQDYQNP
jgi:hypothetical protein